MCVCAYELVCLSCRCICSKFLMFPSLQYSRMFSVCPIVFLIVCLCVFLYCYFYCRKPECSVSAIVFVCVVSMSLPWFVGLDVFCWLVYVCVFVCFDHLARAEDEKEGSFFSFLFCGFGGIFVNIFNVA